MFDEIIESRSLSDLFGAKQSPHKKGSRYRKYDLEKFCHFKIINGLKLPTPEGMKGRRFTPENIIDLSSYFVKMSQKESHPESLILKVIDMYLVELRANPMDMARAFLNQDCLLLADRYMSKEQLNAVIYSMSYMNNFKKV